MPDTDESRDLEARLRKWEATTLKEALKAMPERRAEFVTTSSRPVKRLYTPLDLHNKTPAERLGEPGEYPYTRGIHPTMYRGRLWTMRMFAGFGSAEDTNKRFKYLISHGETGLSVAFDMPTLYGYDTDAPQAKGEFGTCGVAVSSLDDMEILFRGIDVGKISTSMTINAPADVVWAMYLGMAEKQGVAMPALRGTIQNDILKEYEAQKEWIYPPEASMRLVVDTFEFGARSVPQWNTISISGYHIREAGATAGQELAFTLANGMEYVRWGIDRGLRVDDFAPRLSFFFNAHNNFLEEVAKFRAARRLQSREGIGNRGLRRLRQSLRNSDVLRRDDGDGRLRHHAGKHMRDCRPARLVSDGSGVDISVRVFEQRGDLLLVRFVDDERSVGLGKRLRFLAHDLDSQDVSIRLGSDQQVPLGIEGQRSRVALLALIEELALSVRRHDEYLSLIARGHKKFASRVDR